MASPKGMLEPAREPDADGCLSSHRSTLQEITCVWAMEQRFVSCSVSAGIERVRGWLALALGQPADELPPLVVRQATDDPARLAFVAALASEGLNGEQFQLQGLPHPADGLLIEGDRVRDRKGWGD